MQAASFEVLAAELTILRCVDPITDVSKERSASIFRVKQSVLGLLNHAHEETTPLQNVHTMP